MIGGFVAGSQALEVDALDFLGDGVITPFGLLAVDWSMRWRGRAALIQGLFLAASESASLAATAYCVFVLHAPEANAMGLFAVIALAANIIAAWVLRPQRRARQHCGCHRRRPSRLDRHTLAGLSRVRPPCGLFLHAS